MRASRTLAAGILSSVTAVATLLTGVATAPPAEARRWTAAWVAATQPAMPGYETPNWSVDGFAEQSVRQVIRVSVGGSSLQVRLTNRYGTGPLRLAGATIGRSTGGAAVAPHTLRHLTFGGRTTLTIPAGREAVSDATVLRTRPLDKLTLTLYFAAPTGPATFHEGAYATTYRAAGDHRFDTGAKAFDETTRSWYFLAGVDITGSRGSVVMFGDSLTDGHGSTPDADNRYPDEVAERLVRAHRRLGVVNAGVNGNHLLNDVPCFSGDSGVTRFERDVLDQPGVHTTVVLMGTNDIGVGGIDIGCANPPVATAAALIGGYRKMIQAARERDVRIVGATIPPMKGAYVYDTPEHEAVRDAVNEWIRTSGAFDAVADLDAALADPADPDALRPAYDSGDHLHPNDAGAAAMARAVAPHLLGGNHQRAS
ncbi:GDSL-type esterase/lipase family protein [Actinopolymorpha alba]|uniref:GDSL-type esterase/lipase family protein n=1 Tax=Actinopolymorpha alba TaxID=533267 RepID=UPI00036EA60C|nr:GDSL-type esterase/lipase family protein [Actinopolymorpha alba]